MVNKITDTGWPQNEKVPNAGVTELKNRLKKKNKFSAQGLLFHFLPVKNEQAEPPHLINKTKHTFLFLDATRTELSVKSHRSADTDDVLLPTSAKPDDRGIPSDVRITGKPSVVSSGQSVMETASFQPSLLEPATPSMKTDMERRIMESSNKKFRSTINDGQMTFSGMQPSEKALDNNSGQQETVEKEHSSRKTQLQMNRLPEPSLDNDSTQNMLTYPFRTWGEDKSVQIINKNDAGFLLKPSDQQVLNVLQSASSDSPSDLLFEQSFSNSSDRYQDPDDTEKDNE